MTTRIAYSFGLLSTVGLGLALAGCPEDTVVMVDANTNDAYSITLEDTNPPQGDAGRDAGIRRDAGAACGTRANLGGQCASGECVEPLVCQEEVSREVTTVSRADPMMPGRPYPVRYWPGGQCQSGCDVNGSDQCNSCSSCQQIGVDGSGRPVGQCYQNCELDVDGLGGCNEGYACNRANLICDVSCNIVDGVDTCQFSFEDRDEDPTDRETIVDEGTSYPSRCNVATGLCETTGTAGATAGDDCEDDLDCEDDGLCITDDSADAPVTLADGYCIRLGCNDTDYTCQDGDVCTQSLFGLPGGVCLEGCVVGAETTASQIVGTAGGHPACGENEACFWDGVHGTADEFNGGCYPANYNDVPAYNVGASCDQDEDCWSPYGQGRCLFGQGNTLGDRVGGGICAVGSCGGTMMGIGILAGPDEAINIPNPNDVCQTSPGTMGANNDICVNFGGGQTFCVTGCTAATDCPTGYACPNLGDALRPLRLCWPACQEDADCRAGNRCLNDGGAACNPMTDTCYCTDSMPRPDAGPMPRDAGTDAFAPADAFATPDAPSTDDAGTAADAPTTDDAAT